MTALRLKVVAHLRKNGPSTAPKIFQDLGGEHSKQAICMCLSRLAARGQLQRLGRVEFEMGRPAHVFGLKP